MTSHPSRLINTLASAAALACLGNAFAQSPEAYNPSPYVLLNGSVVKPDSKYPENKTGWGGGLKYGLPLDPSWDLQIGANYAASSDHGANFHQTLLGVDALYLFAPGGFRPFVLIGGGLAHDHFGDAAVGTFHRNAPYLNAGLGFQYKFTPTLGMQADVREVGTLYGSRVQPLDMKHSANTYANVGLTWAFGAPAAAAPAPAPRAEPAPAPAPVVAPPPPPPAPLPPPPPAPAMKKYTLSANELFGFDSAKLGPNQPKLDEIASVMNANTTDIPSVTIVGYTDRLGGKPYNLKLSQQRANAVKAYLESKGVASGRLAAVGKGEADPVVECKDAKKQKRAELIKCLEPNRRVEIEPVTYTKPAR